MTFAARLRTAALLLAAAPGFAQEPAPTPTPAPPSFPSDVDLVTVDVVVTDRKGKPVEGLTRDMFEIKEDGKVQTLASFEAVRMPDTSAPPPPRRPVSDNLAAEAEGRTGRTFVVVFDDIHLTPHQAHRAKKAVAEFLQKGTREGDRVVLVSTGGDAWWATRMKRGADELVALLKRLDGRSLPQSGIDRVSEWEAMRIHVYNDAQVMDRVARRFEQYGVAGSAQLGDRSRTDNMYAGEGDPYVRARASEVYWQSSTKNRLTLEVLKRILQSMAGVKGRKSLILVSEGFIYDPNLDEFKDTIQQSRRSNMAIYFLDTRGLGGLSAYFGAEFGPALPEQDLAFAFSESFEASEGAESLAIDSGGFAVRNTNDLAAGIQRIADDSRVYYLLGYNPTNTARDGRFRKIEVKALQKGLKVRARKGYYAPLDGVAKGEKKVEGNDPEIQQALDSPFEAGAIPIRMTSYVFDETLLGKATTIVATDVDIRDFAFREEEGRLVNALEFLLIVAHRESGEYFRYDQKIEFKLQPETKARIDEAWFPIVREFELAPGGYQAKIVVRDQNSREIGSLIHEFDVPALDGLRTSTIVLSDTLQPQPEGSTALPRPTVLARRDLAAGMIYAQYDVYGAGKDAQTNMPKVRAGYEIRKADGTRVAKFEPSEIMATSLGRLSRLVGTPLDNADPGDYEFVLELIDDVTGKTLQVVEPFTLVEKKE